MNRVPALLVLAAACGGRTSPVVDAPPSSTPDAIATADAPPGSLDPANDGMFTVIEGAASIPGAVAGRTLPATVFAPAGGSARPLVVVSPGFQMDRSQYRSYARHLATWGFVVVLTDYADRGFFANHQLLANDVTAVIDYALAQPTLAVDGSRIAAVGHSLGGKISVFAATQEPRIRAVVAWDPVDSQNPSVAPELMASVNAAIAVVGETTNASGGGMPCAPAADNFEKFYAAAPSPALAITVAGADHMDWVDDPSCGFCGFCAAGTAAPELARTVTRRLDVAWLRLHLLDDAAMEPWLASPPELAAGVVAIVRR
ncbi:MAG: dienelactone hydrolase family protein [Myxococcota bacterium]|nr:dienelactone hydrolase family protein [Myxococcota bacterium]